MMKKSIQTKRMIDFIVSLLMRKFTHIRADMEIISKSQPCGIVFSVLALSSLSFLNLAGVPVSPAKLAKFNLLKPFKSKRV